MTKRTFWGVEIPSQDDDDDDDDEGHEIDASFTLPSGPPQDLLALLESAKPDANGILTTAPIHSAPPLAPISQLPPLPPRRPVAGPHVFGHRPGLLRYIGGIAGWRAVFVAKTHDLPEDEPA